MEVISKNQKIMKKISYITSLITLLAFFTTSCDRHDKIDELLIVGKMAPQVYWEIASSTIDAGNNLSFTSQYYTTGDSEIKKLEVWYNIVETIEKEVASPWVTSFTYSITSITSEEKRITEKITEYPHVESNWNNSLFAYTLIEEFPTSPTLSSIAWSTPESFEAVDSVKMDKYYGTGFMAHFKDSLYNMMQAVDFQRMYQGLNLVENFKEQFLDSTKNENTGQWDYHFPELGGEYPVPEEVVEIYKNIPFADLIYNSSNGNYNVSYSKSYNINAHLRVIDNEGNVGKTTTTEISLN